MNDITFKIHDSRFICRTAGINLYKNNILLITENHINCWYLPGGRVSLFESSYEALTREINEELKIQPEIKRLLYTAEEMFKHNEFKQKVHCITFYYLITFQENPTMYKKQSWETTINENVDEKKSTLHFKWFNIKDLKKINLVPKFLINNINNIPKTPKHIVDNVL